MGKDIKTEFFNAFTYSVFKAIGEKIGEESWKIVWRTGELLFNETRNEIEYKKEPLEVVRSLAEYLREVGYLKDAKIVPLDDDEFEYWMKEPVIEKAAFKLIEEGFPPPHISTSLLFSALKNLANTELELVGTPEKREGWIVERWRIKKILSNP